MKNRRGFTLIELLVVISIIALLLAIMMPALAQIRKHALTIKCMANLDQFGNAWAMYFNDYDSKMPIKGDEATWPGSANGMWWNSLFPYYKAHKLRFCPTATDPNARAPWRPYDLGTRNEFNFWPWWRSTTATMWQTHTGYGANDCIYNYTQDQWDMMASFGEEWLLIRRWRTSNVKGAGMIPVLADCYVEGAAAWYNTAEPAYYEDDVTRYGGPGSGSEIRRFFVNRHPNFRTNVLFGSLTVKKVALKAKHSLKWARNLGWGTAGPWTLAGGADYDVWAEHGDGWLKDAPYE